VNPASPLGAYAERRAKKDTRGQAFHDEVQAATYGYQIPMMQIGDVYRAAEQAFDNGQNVTDAVHALLDQIAIKTGSRKTAGQTQNGRTVELSTEHSSSSYGIPVLLVDGVPYAASFSPSIEWTYSNGFTEMISPIGLAASCCLPEQEDLYEDFKNSIDTRPTLGPTSGSRRTASSSPHFQAGSFGNEDSLQPGDAVEVLSNSNIYPSEPWAKNFEPGTKGIVKNVYPDGVNVDLEGVGAIQTTLDNVRKTASCPPDVPKKVKDKVKDEYGKDDPRTYKTLWTIEDKMKDKS
jgi:hypothetical protein